MKQLIYSLTTLVLLIFSAAGLSAQGNLKGVVTDAGNGEGLIGVSIAVSGTSKGTVSDVDGSYALALDRGSHEVVFTTLGYETVTQTVNIGSGDVTLNMSLTASEITLGEVVVTTGSRASQRTITDSPLPIDVFGAKDLQSTGQTSFDKTLQYRVPSFNTVNTPVNDATTLLDPWEIRNLGPSRTLILINGKRKNLSSLLYVQFSPGRGETGVDLSAIPTEAIKRVEILRDGASAQYGSDAMVGVMNIILKDKFDYTSLNVTAGATSEGDGEHYSVALNSGSNLGNNGFLNYTIAVQKQNSAVRSGTIHIPTEIATFGDGGGGAQDQLIQRYLADFPTGGNINGSGESTSGKFLLNAGLSIGKAGQLYGNGAFVAKKVNSFANFRVPYWRQDRGLLHSKSDNGGKNYFTDESTLAFPQDGLALYQGYIGYVPTFDGDLTDYNATVGIRDENNGWHHDVSLTTGGNQQTYTVENTVNRTLGTSSPTTFKPGGYSFKHWVFNVDVSKELIENLNLAFGAEARSETYKIIAGDTASYSGEGANSFPGINAVNANSNSRFNLGGYLDLAYDITDFWLVNGTIRTENYSDFGTATVGKGSTRLKFMDDKLVFRASVSSGFRAPSLHQIYAQSTQASFVGGFVQLSGLFNNLSVQARLLEIPRLQPEKSTNFTFGVGLSPMENFNISLDYYNINIRDRIVYSSSIRSDDPNSTLGQILAQAQVVNIQFFINGIETNTSGLDFVANYRNIVLGAGKMGVNLAANYTLNNEIVGDPKTPKPIADAGASILSAQIRSILTESRPEYKAILGFDYGLGKWTFGLNNTLFGPTRFQDLDNGGGIMNHIKAEFKPKVVTDLSVGVQATNRIAFTVAVNNIFNVLPEWDLEPLDSEGEAAIADPDDKALLRGFLGFSGRYDILGYNGAHFSQLGTLFSANLNVKF